MNFFKISHFPTILICMHLSFDNLYDTLLPVNTIIPPLGIVCKMIKLGACLYVQSVPRIRIPRREIGGVTSLREHELLYK